MPRDASLSDSYTSYLGWLLSPGERFQFSGEIFLHYAIGGNSSRKFWNAHTQRNVFEILLNQPEIRLYLLFSKWIIENGKYNLISVWFDKIYLCVLCIPLWKNKSDQTYSCPRDWRPSASWGTLKSPVHHSTIALRGFKGAVNRAAIMSRDASLSDSESKILI